MGKVLAAKSRAARGGQSAPEIPQTILVAQRFVLTDAQGRVRAELSIDDPMSGLTEAAGPTGPMLKMWDARGVLRLEIGLTPMMNGCEMPQVLLRHTNHMPGIHLSCYTDSTGPEIDLSQPDGSILWSAVPSDDGVETSVFHQGARGKR